MVLSCCCEAKKACTSYDFARYDQDIYRNHDCSSSLSCSFLSQLFLLGYRLLLCILVSGLSTHKWLEICSEMTVRQNLVPMLADVLFPHFSFPILTILTP